MSAIRTSLKVVEIRSADTHALHLDEHPAICHVGERSLLQTDIPAIVENTAYHLLWHGG